MEEGLKTKQKVWIVSELFYPETISTGYIMTEIARSLGRDFVVEVIAGPSSYEGTNESNTAAGEKEFKIHRCDARHYNKNNLFSRVIGNLRTAFKMYRQMRRLIQNGEQVLMVTNPVFLVWLSSLTSARRGWRIKLLVHDVFPDNLIVLKNLGPKSSLITAQLMRSFNKAFRKMDTLIVLGRDMYNVMLSKTGKPEKIKIIPNWTDTGAIIPAAGELNRKFIFAGNLGRVQGIELLLEAILSLDDARCSFLFVGTGAMSADIADFADKHSHINVELKGWVPRNMQNELLAEYGIGVITLKAGMYGLGVPSKLCNLLAAGKPVFYIGDKGSEVELLLSEYNFGWFAEAGNAEEIKNRIKEILDTDTGTLKELSRNARALAEKDYNKKIVLNRFNKLFLNEDID